MPAARARADACPGALSTHTADDGELARVRLPGGALTAAQLLVLADAAKDLGDGRLHLTSRGNLQLRGLRDPSALAERLAAAGLLPSASHERVRNILASPVPGLVDAQRLAAELDRAVCARPALARLPGRFLFAVDSGAGDVAGEDPDVCWRASAEDEGVLLLGGQDSGGGVPAAGVRVPAAGVRIPAAAAVEALVRAAEAFVRVRGDRWRVRELPAAAVDELVDVVCGACKYYQAAENGQFSATKPAPAAGPPPPGRHGTAVVAAVPLGVLAAEKARSLAGLAPGGLVVTPWRTVVLPQAAGVEDSLRGAGLVLTPEAPQAQVSACIGRPGCASALADVRADAVAAMTALNGRRTARAHIAGCERRCGRPHGNAVDVLADGDGYRVDGVWVDAADLADSLLSDAGKGRP